MTKKSITLEGNSNISYQIYGKGKNTIILFHGLIGGSWLDNEAIKQIHKSNVCVVALERIGYGSSSQLELKNVSDWGSIIRQVFVQLSIKTADLIGISAGAPYAYATAYFLPNLVKRIWILSGVPAVYDDLILRHYQEKYRIAYKNFLQTDFSQLQDNYVKQLKALLEQLGENGKRYMIETVKENISQNCYGMALESRLQILPWNIELSQIRQPIIMYHAKEDEMVPFNAAKEMSGNFKNCYFKGIETLGRNVHMECSFTAFMETLKCYR